VSRSMKESQDVARAGETVEALQQQLADLEAQFQAESQALETSVDPMAEKFETITVKPKKTNISITLVALAWLPHWQEPSGGLTAAWE